MALIELLSQNPIFLIGFCFVFSLLIGSFLNVVIHRLPLILQQEWKQQCEELLECTPSQHQAISLSKPASNCPKCQHKIRWYENIPLLSYAWLRGRCSGCATRISIRYPIVEFFTALAAATLAYKLGWGWQLAGGLLMTWCLIALSGIDFDTQLLPDDITMPLLWIGLLFNTQSVFTDLQSAVIGAVAGYMSLWLVFQAFKLVTGKEGMGFGDFKLFAVFGAWFGWEALPLIILLSSVVGAVVGITLQITGALKKDQAMPFGPYLAGAGWIAMLWGTEITRAYLGLLNPA